MAKPVVYFQNWDGTTFPARQEEKRYTEEAEAGVKLTGSTKAKVGLDLGALTNLSSSAEFNILISHNAINPVTNVKFYFQPSNNDRGEAKGFTHTTGASSADNAELDFKELVKWGDDDPGAGQNYGLTLKEHHDTQVQLLKTGKLDSLANCATLTNKGKFNGASTSVGNSISGQEATIEPFTNYKSNDAASVKIQLNIPDIEDAGIRQYAFVTRLTYTF